MCSCALLWLILHHQSYLWHSRQFKNLPHSAKLLLHWSTVSWKLERRQQLHCTYITNLLSLWNLLLFWTGANDPTHPSLILQVIRIVDSLSSKITPLSTHCVPWSLKNCIWVILTSILCIGQVLRHVIRIHRFLLG